MRIGFKHRGLHAVRSWTLAVMFVGCDCDVMFEKKQKWGNTLITKVHLSNFDFIARPAPPCKKPGGQETHKYQKNKKKCKKPCKFHEQITCFLSNTFIMHQMFVVCHDSCWFHVSFGWEVILSSPSFWFHVSEGWEVILSSPSFWFHGFRRVRGNTLITLLFLFHDMLRAKTVEEVDDGYLNP